MGARIDDLEKSIGELISEAGLEENLGGKAVGSLTQRLSLSSINDSIINNHNYEPFQQSQERDEPLLRWRGWWRWRRQGPKRLGEAQRQHSLCIWQTCWRSLKYILESICRGSRSRSRSRRSCFISITIR